MGKNVYFFGNGQADGKADMKSFLGGKGANLAEMTNLGIPVPPGFTISTEVCDAYWKNNKKYPDGLREEVHTNLQKVEKATGKKFGSDTDPLLVSVRSGAAQSMPGMMDTVLNLGLNDTSIQGLITKTKNERFAWDAYRRFINMFGDVVYGIPHEEFEHIMTNIKDEAGAKLDTDLNAAQLKKLCENYKGLFSEKTGKPFPQDPEEQLWDSIGAVFGSWNNDRANAYRRINKITGLIGTAVNVQAMVFGNMGDTSATGVCFTRNPSTGENKFYGEFLINAQGEDVVAGIRTPMPVEEMEKFDPPAYKELIDIRHKLEDHYKDMQDIEFTVQEGKLYLLQTRGGKRTAEAAVRLAVEMVGEGMIDKETAILRVNADSLNQLLHPMFDPKAAREIIGKGLPASPGAAVGKVVFSAEHAEEMATKDEQVILVRIETSPEDIGGMHAARGILTARGGMTSHAAVVARGMGKCCVAGCGDIVIDYKKKQFTADGKTIKEGDFISLNGSAGEVYLGQVPTKEPELTAHFGTLMEWVDGTRKLLVRTNADTPHDSEVARKFGAEGIGLCRTEHMFFEGDRIIAFREMILAETLEGRKAALAKLLPIQRDDFVGIFRAMEGLPVTVRLLDPPLHEFVPHEEDQQQEMAKVMGIPVEKVKDKVESLKEFNPMLGHRGCRLGITYPEIYDMQARAIIEAACIVQKEGKTVLPEIMIPLVGIREELSRMREIVINAATETMKSTGVEVEYLVGTMIEIPRAALIADKIAEVADFFSFGTNDLTQMAFGFSRDDAGVFLGEYVEKGVLKDDPFQALDQEGVGQLVQLGVERGRSTKPKLKVGICGEHGGEPSSVIFCHKVGMNYVSCSPFRVPIARLAAAQAVILDKKK